MALVVLSVANGLAGAAEVEVWTITALVADSLDRRRTAKIASDTYE